MTILGVGLIGAGPGVAALHLPTLARLGDRFRVVHVADHGSGRAEMLASRTGSRHSSGTAELFCDPEVEVVAVCSPPERHAEHVRAAVEAGKRAILCEKPIGIDAAEAAQVVEMCRSAGVALVVGTNHLYDAAWARAKRHLKAEGVRAVRSLSVTMALPANGRYHALVTQDAPPGAQTTRPAPDWTDRRVSARVVRQLLLGLAIHDLPLIRELAPRFERIMFALPVPPIGYAVGFVASGVAVRLTAVMLPGGADALWRFAVDTEDDRLEVEFPPAFVHHGSGTVRVRSSHGGVAQYPPAPRDGYEAEWRALADLIDGVTSDRLDEILADAAFAIDVADAAAEWIQAGGAA